MMNFDYVDKLHVFAPTRIGCTTFWNLRDLYQAVTSNSSFLCFGGMTCSWKVPDELHALQKQLLHSLLDPKSRV